MVWVEKSILFGAFQVGEPDEFFLWLDLGLLIWKRIGTCIVGRLAARPCQNSASDVSEVLDMSSFGC